MSHAPRPAARRLPPSRPLLCAVTDRSRLAEAGAVGIDATVALIRSMVAAGVDLVQIREAGLPDRTLGRLVELAALAAQGTPTRILVNDRVDVARAHGADGVHLKGSSPPAARIRELAGADWIVGRSIHGLAEGRRVAAAGGLDYLVLGTVYTTVSKPGRTPLGAGPLRAAAAALPLPVLAIGGMTPARVPEVAASGAAGFAAVGLFAELAQLPTARAAVTALRAAWSAAG